MSSLRVLSERPARCHTRTPHRCVALQGNIATWMVPNSAYSFVLSPHGHMPQPGSPALREQPFLRKPENRVSKDIEGAHRPGGLQLHKL